MKIARTLAYVLPIVIGTVGYLHADDLFQETAEGERVLASDVVIYRVEQRGGQPTWIEYYHWNSRADLLGQAVIEFGRYDMNSVRMVLGASAERQALVASIQEKGVRALVLDVNYVATEIYCLKMNYGADPAMSRLGIPFDDTKLFVQTLSGVQRILDLRDISRLDFEGEAARIILKSGGGVSGRVERLGTAFGEPLPLAMKLTGIDRRGYIVSLPISEVASVEFLN